MAVAFIANVQAETLVIHGSTTIYSNLFAPYKADLEKETAILLDVLANGSSRGIKGLDSGAAQVAMLSSTLESTLAKLDMADRADEFKDFVIGEERIVFAVHPSNTVDSLTKDQVVGILNGSITNWRDVGGADAPITVVIEYAGGGYRTTAEKKLLGGAEITAPNLRSVPNATQAVVMATGMKEALLVIPTATLGDAPMKKITTDAEISQPLILVTKGEPSDAALKLITAAKAKLN